MAQIATKKLNIAPPPMFEQAIGYEGHSRLIGLYWSREGSDVVCEDGIEIMVGAHLPAWHEFINHRVMLPYTATFHLGNDYVDARYWLLLDRVERRFYIDRPMDAKRRLVEQHAREPLCPPFAMDINDVLNTIEEARERLSMMPAPPDETEIMEKKETMRRNATDQMHRWLNQSDSPISHSHLRLVYPGKK